MHYCGLNGRMITACRPITSMPIFAKAGAIIPMAQYDDNRLSNSEDMQVLVFPGASNAFVLYEDAGDGHDFETGAFCQTQMQLTWGENAQFVIEPAVGQTNLIPQERNWEIHLRGFHKSISVQVSVDGAPVEATCRFEPKTHSTVVTLRASTQSRIRLNITGDALIHDNSDWLDRCAEIIHIAETAYHLKDRLWKELNGFETIHSCLWLMGRRCSDRENRQILAALREMLTLEKEEFPKAGDGSLS